MSPAPALPEPAPVSPGAPAPVAPVAPVASVPQPGLPLWSHLLALLMAVGGAGLITFILRRHRQVLEEGRRVEQALGGGLLEAPAEPVRRGAARLGAPDALAALPAPDPFTVAARTRAADLAHLLPAEGVDRLRRALEAVAQGSGRRDSALARTILESDPELRLRFDLLALEGELEARAATAWWEQIEATDGDPE